MRFFGIFVSFVMGVALVGVIVFATLFVSLQHPTVFAKMPLLGKENAGHGERSVLSAKDSPLPYILYNEGYGTQYIRVTWEPIADYEEGSTFRELARPVGLLKVRWSDSIDESFCSAVLVHEFTVLTAAHCLLPQKGQGQTPGARIESITIDFNYLDERNFNEEGIDSPSERQIFSLDPTPLSVSTDFNDSVDFAFLRARGNLDAQKQEIDPVSIWGKVEISRSPIESSEENQPAIIIHHPSSQAMQITRYRCYISGSRWYRGYDRSSFDHHCDTDFGSSGAPVFDAEDLTLIGIHRARPHLGDQSGVTNEQALRAQKVRVGLRNVFSSIHDIKKNSKLLEAIIQHSNRSLDEILEPLPVDLQTTKTTSANVDWDALPLRRLGLLETSIARSDVTPRWKKCNSVYVGDGKIVTPFHCITFEDERLPRDNNFRFDEAWRLNDNETFLSPDFSSFFEFSQLPATLTDQSRQFGIPQELFRWVRVRTRKQRGFERFDVAIMFSQTLADASGRIGDKPLLPEGLEIRDFEASPMIEGEKVSLIFFGNQSNELNVIECAALDSADGASIGRLYYDCPSDTDYFGSSGGLVLDAESRFVALHQGYFGKSGGAQRRYGISFAFIDKHYGVNDKSHFVQQ